MANNNDNAVPATTESLERDILAQECVEMLVEHGYHRASLVEIPIYERVVGGLVFCLQSEELTSVDCDILFRPVATVKERVRVAEAICHSFNTALMSLATTATSTKALTLSVHELQGANYAKLKLVVAWLVQHTQIKLNTRVQQAIQTQWNDLRTTSLGTQPPRPPHAPWYRVERQSKFRPHGETNTEQERIQRCLLEYGERLASPAAATMATADHDTAATVAPSANPLLSAIAKQAMAIQRQRDAQGDAPVECTSNDDFDRLYKTAEKEAGVAEQRALLEQQRHQDELLRHAAATHDDKYTYATANAEALHAASVVYETTSDSIRQRLRQQARGLDVDASPADAFGRLAATRKWTRDRQKLLQKGQAQEAQLHNANLELHTLQVETARLEALESTSVKSFHALERKQEQLEMREAAVTNAHDLLQLRTLIALHTNLKLQESQFKASCTEQLASLQSRQQALVGSSSSKRGDDVADNVVQIEQRHQRVVDKRMELKRAVAKEAQGILAAMRRIDSIPSRSELIQYEKRFAELYDEVHTKPIQPYKIYFLLLDTNIYIYICTTDNAKWIYLDQNRWR
ncbi:hypothetical protein, variant [Aphanomyces astaci]|uniref:Uncharacterized protein n=1 Tax=Aphanomyces astaci TaxID=112090 RepID=W4GBS4_APHAT|nr:hypothetical protein, variant [Aphanomyces astaci]ETV76413.1 hypothetical protein, variant [Aphanomyces astaci]|eukprot:XP_009833958.1 hypothetical protein, variant [Aphanomyces astaci]